MCVCVWVWKSENETDYSYSTENGFYNSIFDGMDNMIKSKRKFTAKDSFKDMYLVVHVGEGEREEGEQGGGRLVCCNNRVKKVFQTHRKEGLKTTHVCTSTPSWAHYNWGQGDKLNNSYRYSNKLILHIWMSNVEFARSGRRNLLSCWTPGSLLQPPEKAAQIFKCDSPLLTV